VIDDGAHDKTASLRRRFCPQQLHEGNTGFSYVSSSPEPIEHSSTLLVSGNVSPPRAIDPNKRPSGDDFPLSLTSIEAAENNISSSRPPPTNDPPTYYYALHDSYRSPPQTTSLPSRALRLNSHPSGRLRDKLPDGHARRGVPGARCRLSVLRQEVA
jgi:hypothetical protein